VARGVVGLVLGYITSVVVDLAVLIEVINFYFIIIFWLHIQMFLESVSLMERVGTLYITDGDMCSMSTMIRPKVSKSCQSIF
jgi:hypothetical protein